jgi:hypothetical protein
MSETVRLSVIVMFIAGGIFAGGLVWYAWDRVLIWQRLTLLEFAIDFRRSLRKADPAMPILLLICGSGATVFATQTDGAARTLALASLALLGTILVSSVVAEPINSQFRRRPEGVVPPEADRLRTLWRRFHLVRTAFGVAAYALLIVAATYAH